MMNFPFFVLGENLRGIENAISIKKMSRWESKKIGRIVIYIIIFALRKEKKKKKKKKPTNLKLKELSPAREDS